MLSFATPAGEAPEPPKTPALPPPVAGTGLAARIAQAEQMLLDHQSRVVAETAGSLVFQQRAAEFKVISTELRMLKQEQRDEELRAGQWVRRARRRRCSPAWASCSPRTWRRWRPTRPGP
jgi:hypothetical protein